MSGQYAINFVQGMERNPADPGHIQASACCKHYVANELESWNGQTRHTFNANVTMQDLQDSYLPPFQACVEEGKVGHVSACIPPAVRCCWCCIQRGDGYCCTCM